MKILPSNLKVASRSRDMEPADSRKFGVENMQGVDHGHGSTKLLPPLALESCDFRRTVWAHMDPFRRGRMNLEDFEDRLNALPLETPNNVSTLSCS